MIEAPTTLPTNLHGPSADTHADLPALPPIYTGDLQDVPHKVRISVFNNALDQQRRAQKPQQELLEPNYATPIAALERKMHTQRERLTERNVRQGLHELATRFEPIHEDSSLSPLEKLAHCFAQSDNIGVLSDFDRSMTRTTRTATGWAPEVEYLVPNVPASILFEKYLAKYGREKFTLGFVKIMQAVLREHPYLFEAAGREIALRDGVTEFGAKLQTEGIPFTVVSANFDEIIKGRLANTPLEHARRIAIKHDDISSKDKRTVVKLLAAENPDRALIFIGDGPSDMEIAEAYAEDHILAGIFALKGSEFDKQLTDRHIPHLTYNNFNDISYQFFQAKTMAQQLRQQAA